MPERRPLFRLAGPPAMLVGMALASPADAQSPSSSSPLPTPLTPLAVTQIDDASRAAFDGAPTVSLSIARPMPLRDLLRLLVTGTAVSLVFDEPVTGTFEGELRSLTLRQAIEAALRPRGFDYDVQGTVLRVFPRRPRTRLFAVNYVNTGAAAGGAASPYEAIARGVEALLSPSGRAHVDRVAGLVQVTDFADRLDQVALYVEAAQLRALRQVQLEARVLEVTLPAGAPSRVDWARVLRVEGAARATAGAAGIRVRDFDALQRAIGEQGAVTLLAAPRIVALNNVPAVLRVGSTEAHFSPGAAAATAFTGLSVSITAQVADDGIVQIHAAPHYSEKLSAGGSAVAEAETSARLADGETLVLSGFLSRRGAGSPPASTVGTRSDLVILLTPKIVVPGQPALESR